MTELATDEYLVTYELRVIGPQSYSFLEAAALKLQLEGIMREAEENMTDLLPEGHRVEIKEAP